MEDEVISSSSDEELPRAPQADISRDRSMSHSSQPVGKRTRVAGGPSTKTKRFGAATRVAEFPKEPFSVSLGSLYCKACHMPLQSKLSIIKAHIGTERHTVGKNNLQKSALRQATIAAGWSKYKKDHPAEVVGSGLSSAVLDDVSKRRIDVVETFLRAGVQLAKVPYLRPLLEAGNLRLTDRSHMAQFIPFLMETEMNRVKEDVKGADFLAVIFDGSTHQGEALAILLRYLDHDWIRQQRLVHFHVLAKSLTGVQLAGELVAALSTTLQLKPTTLVAAIRDGAAVNRVAVERVKEIMYGDLLDVICMPHSLDNVGWHFDTPILDEFLQWWVSLFARSPAPRLLWKARAGVAVKSQSNTRWWSTYEVGAQLMEFFGDVQPFLTECQYSPSACQHLKRILNESKDLLKMELAATVDAGKVFVQKTYVLEGDGILSTQTYAHLQEYALSAAVVFYPNDYRYVASVAKDIAGNDDVDYQQELLAHAKQCFRPAIDYFLRRFNHREGDLFPLVRAFKAARLFSPHFVSETRPTLVQIDALRVFPALNTDAAIAELKEELPAYL
eukprot:scpid46117/ scgid1592/ 